MFFFAARYLSRVGDPGAVRGSEPPWVPEVPKIAAWVQGVKIKSKILYALPKVMKNKIKRRNTTMPIPGLQQINAACPSLKFSGSTKDGPSSTKRRDDVVTTSFTL